MFKYTLAATLDEMDREGITVAECPLRSMRCLSLQNGRIVGINDINLVVTLVGHSELAFRCQFFFEQFLGNRLNDFLYHFFSF